MNHPSSCFDAKSKDCTCQCGGRLHGRKSGNVTDDVDVQLRDIAVGDIVTILSDGRATGCKGFVEEIIRDFNPQGKWLRRYGKYSIYGFVPLGQISTHDDTKTRYYGDHIGYELEPTGEKMTPSKLEDYHLQEPNNLGLKTDMKIVINNLGRKKGRNEK